MYLSYDRDKKKQHKHTVDYSQHTNYENAFLDKNFNKINYVFKTAEHTFYHNKHIINGCTYKLDVITFLSKMELCKPFQMWILENLDKEQLWKDYMRFINGIWKK